MKKIKFGIKRSFAVLLSGSLTAACVYITPTEYLWQNSITHDGSAQKGKNRSVIDDVGNTYQTFSIGTENFLRKLSAAGVELWCVTIKVKGEKLTVAQNGIIAVGEKDGSTAYATMISPDGSEVWSKALAKPGSLLKLVNASGQTISVVSTAYNETKKIEELTFSLLNLDGTQRWTYTYDDKFYVHDYYPPFELIDGNFILLLPAAIDESSPDYQLAASTLTSVLLDRSGREIGRHDLGIMTYNSQPSYFLKDDHIYFTRHQGDNSILSRLGADGAIEWSYVVAGMLSCSAPAEDRIGCINTDFSAPGYKREDKLQFVGLDGALVSSSPLPYRTEWINSFSSVLFNGENRWIIKEYVGPESAINLADALLPKNFYFKYHAFDQDGLETSSILTAPGKVRFDLSITGQFVVPVVVQKTDIPNQASAVLNRLFVSGWHGDFDGGNGFVRSYELN